MNTRKEKIHKYNIFYKILWSLVMFGVRNFYRRIEIAGKENIPYGSRFIITPNHQNALMDAMAVLFFVKGKDTIFMTRADIFKKKSQERILTFLKMLPIYRIRDGIQELSKNEEIFERSLFIISERTPLCLMPEGNHGDKRRLRNFVKGAFRIAFRSQEMAGDSESVKILPVGIDYQHYQKYHQDLLVIFGKPVDVLDYMAIYRENQPKGINALKDRLADEMRKLMIHINNDELYDMFQNMRHIWNERMRLIAGIRGKSLFDKFRADKLMISILDNKYETEPDTLRNLAEKTKMYINNLDKLNLRNWVIEREGSSFLSMISRFLLLVLFSPLALYGFINNRLPYIIPVKKIKTLKDKQFHSSFKFAFALLMFPAFYIVQSVLVGLLTGPAWIGWAYFLSLPVTGYLALYWSFHYKKLKAAISFRNMKRGKNTVLENTIQLHRDILDCMQKICTDYIKKIPLKEEKLQYV